MREEEASADTAVPDTILPAEESHIPCDILSKAGINVDIGLDYSLRGRGFLFGNAPDVPRSE